MRRTRDLALVVGTSALFILADLCGLLPEDAIASCAALAATITTAALRVPRRTTPR